MLVRESPPTFGYYRITTLARSFPELGRHVEAHGLPDFLVETRHAGLDCLILYDLKERQAYACKIRSGKKRNVSFDPPCRITDSECEVLDGFRRRSL